MLTFLYIQKRKIKFEGKGQSYLGNSVTIGQYRKDEIERIEKGNSSCYVPDLLLYL
jgi:hypothetical protein